MRKTLSIIILGLLLALPALAEQSVVFNTKSLIYHLSSCGSARACTKNCITLSLGQALAKGGVPCKNCHPPAR